MKQGDQALAIGVQTEHAGGEKIPGPIGFSDFGVGADVLPLAANFRSKCR